MTRRACKKCGKWGHYEKTCGDATTKKRKKGKRKGWVKGLGETFEAATAAVGEDEKKPETGGAFADLPAIDVPVPPMDESSPSVGGADESSADTSSAPASDQASTPSGNPSDAKGGADGKKSDPLQDPVLLGEWAGQMYGQLLATGSAYAVAGGGMGLGDEFIKMASQAASFLVTKYAKDSGVTTEEGAWFVVGGSGAFVGWQAYSVWAKAKKEENAAKAAQAGHAAAPATPRGETPKDGHVNGAAQQPTALVKRDAPEQRVAPGQVY